MANARFAIRCARLNSVMLVIIPFILISSWCNNNSIAQFWALGKKCYFGFANRGIYLCAARQWLGVAAHPTSHHSFLNWWEHYISNRSLVFSYSCYISRCILCCITLRSSVATATFLSPLPRACVYLIWNPSLTAAWYRSSPGCLSSIASLRWLLLCNHLCSDFILVLIFINQFNKIIYLFDSMKTNT